VSSKDPPAGTGGVLGVDLALGLEIRLLVGVMVSAVLVVASVIIVLPDRTVRVVGMLVKGVALCLLACI
jgi:hypothetical protein